MLLHPWAGDIPSIITAIISASFCIGLSPGPIGTPTKRQVSKRQISKRLVSKRPVSKRQVYKTSGLQNVRFQNVWFQNVQFLNLIYLLNKKYLYLSFLLITSHYGDM
jgi:hypothetical protein